MKAVVTTRNAHVFACGLPPGIENGENRYIGWDDPVEAIEGRPKTCPVDR